jgi:uncharacterized protein (TIGR02145 family)
MKLFVKFVIAACLLCGAAFPQMEAMTKEEFEAWRLQQREQQRQAELERSMTPEEKEERRMELLAQKQKQEAKKYYTGDGGQGIRLAVLEPAGKGLSADEQWMPSLVQGSITGDINKFSGMTIIDRQNIEKVFAEWKESMSGNYSDADRVKIGNLTSASHILAGSISKTKTTFMLELTVTDVASGERKASYSPTPVSTQALEDLSALKTATADLLRQLGVELTDAARGELTRVANTARIQAETALARGIAAQRRGTEVEALSYFFQAAALDFSLIEASKRSLVVAANISSGNIGADARNDIEWRKKWVARLKETEEVFYKMINPVNPPYTLYYYTDIKAGKINYQQETIDIRIATDLSANWPWFNTMARALKAADAVRDGLNATNRESEWGLGTWPYRCGWGGCGPEGVSATNPFGLSKEYDITVVFELVNQHGRVIGSQTVKLRPAFKISRDGKNRFYIDFTRDTRGAVNFSGVRANDITDNLTIRVASVNGAPPQNARFTITAISAISAKTQPLIDTRDGKKYNAVRIGSKTWMAENLNYMPQVGNSWCYDNNYSNCDKYGKLYDWNTAMNACPSGWHLPAGNEWNHLVGEVENIGGVGGGTKIDDEIERLKAELEGRKFSIAGIATKLKATNGWNDNGNGTDDYGFSALPGGVRNSDGSFGGVGVSGDWWTATRDGGDGAYYRYMRSDIGDVGEYSHAGYGFSVRCVAD